MRLIHARRHAAFVAASAAVLLAASAAAAPAGADTFVRQLDPDTYTCPQGTSGFVNFETLEDKTDLTAGTISGVAFTTTDGLPWIVGDFAAGGYSGKYPSGSYTSRGTHWAWLGPNQPRGRLDFPSGRVSYVSVLVSASSPVSLEAYDENGALLETAGPSSRNVNTGMMDELRVSRSRKDIHHVVVHDSGNLFLVDGLCTDARGVTGDPTVARQWVALGDSFSAGVGLGKVTKGTCDRDDGAYAPVAWRALNKSGEVFFDTFTNASCIGAVTADYGNRQDRDGVTVATPQRDAITEGTDVVTMTFGGNDAYLAKKIAGCWAGRCGPDVFGVEAGTEDADEKLTWDELFQRLVSLYVDARGRMSRSGYAYVLGYPAPFALDKMDGLCNGFDFEEQSAASAFATRLTDTVFLAVQSANAALESAGRPGHIRFVEWRTGARTEGQYTVAAPYPNAGQSFATYASPNGLCSKTPFLNDFKKFAVGNPDKQNSFHPNSAGYGYAAEQLQAAILQDF